jgi:hypothetical protein
MRLINTRTLELREFTEAARPRFAVLSHRWEDGEVSTQQFADPDTYQAFQGYQKIRLFCAQALEDGFEWAWADTVCIDKVDTTNSLVEAATG